MSLVYWDSMLFIYLVEDNPLQASIVETTLAEMRRRGDTLCTSIFTVGEVLTGPYAKGATDVAEEIREFLGPPDVQILPFSAETTEYYAKIRARNRVKPADAIHLATAAAAGVDLFLTHDRALHGLIVPGIQFVMDMHANFF